MSQADGYVTAMVEGATQAFAAQRSLRADLARIKKNCGPGACS